MINIEMTGICEGCDKADLEIECLETESFAGRQMNWGIRCLHQEACERICEVLDNELKNETN